MNVYIYYGGRGLIEDPTLYVLTQIENVLEELRVNVVRYNLFDMKGSIVTLPQTLKDADGVILAASVEWMGIGGYMQEFLDACWLYGDKTKISTLYMAPVVIATTYGEKEAELNIKTAWELLGGLLAGGISAYVDDSVEFEMNKDYTKIIEKMAEDLYRRISQKIKNLPSSNMAIKQNMLKVTLDLTPQEGEQLSKYVADDYYVKQQKEDIEELATMFKGILSQQGEEVEKEFINDFKKNFVPDESFRATYALIIEDKKKTIFIDIKGSQLTCKYEKREDTDVLAKISYDSLRNIVKGRQTFQKAFYMGDMKARGNLKYINMLDKLFDFENG